MNSYVTFLPDFLTLGTSSNTAEEGQVRGYHFVIPSYYMCFFPRNRRLTFWISCCLLCLCYAQPAPSTVKDLDTCSNVYLDRWMRSHAVPNVLKPSLLFWGLIQRFPTGQGERHAFGSIFRASVLKSNCSNLSPWGLKRLGRMRFCQVPQHEDRLLLCSQGNNLWSHLKSAPQRKLHYDHFWGVARMVRTVMQSLKA